MLYDEVVSLYEKSRLVHYRKLFGRIREKEGSLSATEAFAADVISLLGKPTIKQFSDCLGISQPNATYKINNLIAKGYIEKLPSDGDKRETRVHACNKHFAYCGGQNDFIADAVRRLEAECSQEELEVFEKMIKKLSESVEKED